MQGVHEVEFRWFTRPEMSEPGSELTPLCGVVNDNCPEEIRPNTEEVKELEPIMIKHDGGHTVYIYK